MNIITINTTNEVKQENTKYNTNELDKGVDLCYLQGGVSVDDNTNRIRKYKPVMTSKYISIYEYAKVLTDLSLFLFNQKSLSKYINNIEVKNIIDTNKIAYELLKNKVFDAIIDRGYEKVNYSELIVNPLWENMVEQFLNEQEDTINDSFLTMLKLI